MSGLETLKKDKNQISRFFSLILFSQKLILCFMFAPQRRRQLSERHSEPRHTSKMERLAKIVDAASFSVYWKRPTNIWHTQIKLNFDLEAFNTKNREVIHDYYHSSYSEQ